MKSLSVPEQHQKNIAIKTLKMNDVMARVMGGMSKDEARKFLQSIGYTDAQVRKLEARMKTASQWTRMTSTQEQEDAVATIERWLKRLGKSINGGTTIGKDPQTVILDLKYQGGEIRVNSSGFDQTKYGNAGVEVYGEPIRNENSFNEFKRVVEKNAPQPAPTTAKIASELVKLAKELVAKDGVVVINSVPFRIVGNELYIYPAGYYKEDEDGVIHTTSGAEMTLRMNASDRKALANFLTK
jgi:hypothetical protein